MTCCRMISAFNDCDGKEAGDDAHKVEFVVDYGLDVLVGTSSFLKVVNGADGMDDSLVI